MTRLGHGLYSDLHPGSAAVVADTERFMAAQLVDEGGAQADLTARRGSLLLYRGVVHKNLLKLSTALEDRGLFDSKGKLRTTWLQALGVLLDKATRLDSLLGLNRKPRRTQSPVEWLESLKPTDHSQSGSENSEPDQ